MPRKNETLTRKHTSYGENEILRPSFSSARASHFSTPVEKDFSDGVEKCKALALENEGLKISFSL